MNIEELEQCPYILNPFIKDAKEVSFFIEDYGKYCDVVICKDGKPDKVFRISEETKINI